jgi:hypothetical protein
MIPTQAVEFGKVKWLDRNKGYGFIVDNKGQDVFFHVSGLRYIEADREGYPIFGEQVLLEGTRIREGEEIVFVRIRTPRGPQASSWGFAQRWRLLEEDIPRMPVKEAVAELARGRFGVVVSG